jgi:hypothetical protein
MSDEIRAVTVYCSSSKKVAPVYFTAARDLGRGIARCGWNLVYGGNHIGCMGALADGARTAGGKVIGITPQLLVDKGIADEQCDELVVTKGMRQRKALLEQRGDAFVAMPGGIGTLDEIFEILVGRYLGYHDKPIVLLNVERYYAPLLEMLRHGLDQKFIRDGTTNLLFVADDIEAALAYLKSHLTPPKPPRGPAQTPPSVIE